MKEKTYPDFIFTDTDENKPDDYSKIYVVETKGWHLKNEDTTFDTPTPEGVGFLTHAWGVNLYW